MVALTFIPVPKELTLIHDCNEYVIKVPSWDNKLAKNKTLFFSNDIPNLQFNEQPSEGIIFQHYHSLTPPPDTVWKGNLLSWYMNGNQIQGFMQLIDIIDFNDLKRNENGKIIDNRISNNIISYTNDFDIQYKDEMRFIIKLNNSKAGIYIRD